MTIIHLRYDKETNRVLQTHWGNDDPEWDDEQRNESTTTTTDKSQQARLDALNSALNSVEGGTDYDPDIEAPVGKLCYDPDADELYGEVEIQPLPS